MLCAMTRRTPAPRAAATSVPETSRRSRLVRSKPRFIATGLTVWGRLVNWLTTTSGCADWTARVRASASKASPTAATIPGTPRAATRPSRREKTTTSCPAAASEVTSGRPMAPVPPATKIRIHAEATQAGGMDAEATQAGGMDAEATQARVQERGGALAGCRDEPAQRLPGRAPGLVPGPGRRARTALVGRLRLEKCDQAIASPPDRRAG